MAGEMTRLAQVFYGRVFWGDCLATTVSPASFKKNKKHLKNDNIPLHDGRRRKAIAKMTLTVENLRAASSPVRWTSCTKYFFFPFSSSSQEDYDYLLAQSSPGCGCLPRYVQPHSSCVKVIGDDLLCDWSVFKKKVVNM